MARKIKAQKVLVVGAGPVGALAAIYAAERGDDVHVYELRAGKGGFFFNLRFRIPLKQPSCLIRLLLEESQILLYYRKKSVLQPEYVN